LRSQISARPFEPRDAQPVAALFAAYMTELFGRANAMTADVLLRDGQGRHFRMIVAVDGTDRPVGFAAWRPTYDLHHAVAGGEIPDLFVAPAYRHRALAIRLIAAVARAVRNKGGRYVCGDVLTDDTKRLRVARRVGAGYPAETVYLSGRGFREVADLADADIKTLVGNLPPAQASREP
jgi:GNAT superfamily N-acetyltransferase